MSWLKKLLTKKYTEKELNFFDFLRKNIVFNLLSNEDLEKIIPIIHLRDYSENEVVYFRGDPSQAIYIVYKGVVTLSIENEEILKKIKVGHIFGQNGIIEGSKRNYDAIVTSEKTEIYVIPQQALLELFSRDEKLRSKVMTAFTTYFAGYVSRIFDTYRANKGFFEMNQVYKK